MEKNLFTCNQVSASTWWRGTADSSAFLMKPRVVSGGSLSGVSKGSKIFLEKFKRNVTVYRKLPIQFRTCLISAWYSNCFEIGEKYLKYEAPFHPETNLRQQNFKPSQIFWRDICLDRFHPLGHDNLPHLKRFGEQITNELFKHNQSTFQEITPQKKHSSHLRGDNTMRHHTAQAMEPLHVLAFYTWHGIPASSNLHIAGRVRRQTCAQHI